MLDSTIVVMTSTLVISFITYFASHWVQLYNSLIFLLYRMERDPFNYIRAPFIVNTIVNITNEEFRKKLSEDVYIYIRCLVFSNTDITCEKSMLIKILFEFIKTRTLIGTDNSCTSLVPANGYFLEMNDFSLTGYWLCGISRQGYPVYLGSSSHIYCEDPRGFGEFRTAFHNYIAAKLKEYKTSPKEKSGAIYIPNFDSTGRLELTIHGALSMRKTFTSLFFEQKPELLNLLTKFKEGSLYPPHIPIDNKLGILLYGPPGTGKTATLTAIANLLGRNLLHIRFSLIQNCEQFDAILNKIDYTKYVIEFDEFDLVLNALSSSSSQTPKETFDYNSLVLLTDDERKMVLEGLRKKRSPSSPIDLAYILQKLDGIESANNRIIVATTNHIENINPALLRPGRFDLKLCLDRCTSPMVADILGYYYQCDPKEIDVSNVPDKVVSPVELLNLAIQRPDVESVLQEIGKRDRPSLSLPSELHSASPC